MRRSPRLPSFDYSTAGAYFVTVTTNDRACLFGELRDTATINLNDAGRMIHRWWYSAPQNFPTTELDASVVMPDHFHGIVLLHASHAQATPVSLSKVMQWFKSMTTTEYFRHVKGDGWPRVDGKLWQRSYYDHIIRNESDLMDIRTYIERDPGALYERHAGRTHRSAPTRESNPRAQTVKPTPSA